MTYDASVDTENGDLMFLYIGGLPVAFCTGCNIDLSKETIDVSSKMSGDWKETRDGKRGWTASSESLLTKKAGALSFDTLFTAFNTKTPVTLVYGKTLDSTADKTMDAGWYTGTARITSLSQKSDLGANVTCSVSFEGTGALATATAPVVAVKSSQTYTAGGGFKQLIYTVDGVEKTSGGAWIVSTAKAGVGVTANGEIFADTGTTGGTIGVKVTYLGIQSAAVNITVS